MKATDFIQDPPLFTHTMETPVVPPVLTIKGVAELLQVSVRTVERLPIRSTLVRSLRRYQTKDVMEYLERFAE